MTPPFVLGILASSQVIAAAGDYESIATVTVGSGGSADIEFTSIPSDFAHLQIRAIARTTTGSSAGADWVLGRVNADSGSNYSRHYLYGTGSSVVANGETSQTSFRAGLAPMDGTTASMYGAFVIDILDYANTNKYKTLRVLLGSDRNGAGEMILQSNSWMSTSAITSIKLYPEANNFKQYSHFALYGIKGA
jgi:hypothetical protein